MKASSLWLLVTAMARVAGAGNLSGNKERLRETDISNVKLGLAARGCTSILDTKYIYCVQHEGRVGYLTLVVGVSVGESLGAGHTVIQEEEASLHTFYRSCF